MFFQAGSSRRLLRAGSALAVLSGACALLVARPAVAQSEDAASAQALFDEAKKTMEAGDLASACPKFAESQRLDPGIGTLTGLALCHEKQGKTASAWAEYLEVVTEAGRANQPERAKFAKQHAADLEPKLSKLTITVAPETAKLAGLAIKRDDNAVRAATWGVALPVDPGTHTVEATATGKQKWTSQVEVGAQTDSKSLAVPALEEDTTANATPDSAPPKTDEGAAEKPASEDGGGKRIAGLVIGGVGVLGLAGGTIFGIEAISKSNQAKGVCSPSLCTGPGAAAAVATNNDAKSSALISDIGFGVGIAGLAVGAFLFFTAPNGQSPAAAPQPAAASKNTFRITPFVAREGGGAAFLATW